MIPLTNIMKNFLHVTNSRYSRQELKRRIKQFFKKDDIVDNITNLTNSLSRRKNFE